MAHMLYSAIPHTYSDDIIITPRLTLTEEYSDSYAIYIRAREDEVPKYYDILQVLSKHKGYYYIDNVLNTERIAEDMEQLEGEKRVVVYVDEVSSWDDNCRMIEDVFQGNTLNEGSLIYDDENWDVYLMNII